MKTIIGAALVCIPLVFLSGCAVERVTYAPGYTTDYVYSVGNYSNRPYWNNTYYYNGYGLRNYGYWGTYDLYDSF